MSERGLIEALILSVIVILGATFMLYEGQKNAELQGQLDIYKIYFSQMQKGYLNCVNETDDLFKSAEENKKYYQAEIQKWKQTFDEMRPIYDWEYIAWNNAISQDYQKDQYDCTQFSKELMRLLKQKGYEPVCIYGRTYSQKEQKWVKHDWVQLPLYIEATTGIMITPEDFAKNYEIIERGVCE